MTIACNGGQILHYAVHGCPHKSLIYGNFLYLLQPQDPSAFLKAVLKISGENTQQSVQPAAPAQIPLGNTVPQKENQVLDTPPLVQQLFDVSIERY